MSLILVLLNFQLSLLSFINFSFIDYNLFIWCFGLPHLQVLFNPMSSINVFLPVVLRSGIKFRNLRRYKFQASEINWLCGEILGTNEPWEFHISTLRSISRRYKLPVDGLRYFLSMYNENSPILKGRYGCPSDGPVDMLGTKRVLTYAHKHRDNLSLEGFSSFVSKQMDATILRRRKIELQR